MGFSAKEIKPGGPNIGRRIKKVVDRSVIEERLKPNAASNSPSASYSSSPSITTGSTTAAVKQRPSVPGSGHHHASHNVLKSGSHSPHSHSTGNITSSRDDPTHRQNSRVRKPTPNPTVFNLPIR